MNSKTGRQKRFLGVTVLGDFILNEGIDPVLENVIGRAGATAVAVNPTVTAPSKEGEGSFQPPPDAGSSPRLFDRPLWGKPALWVRSAPSFRPNLGYYAHTPYAPRQSDDLTDIHGPLIRVFIRAARRRGLKVYLQLGAASPPLLREEDTPRLPDGRIPDRMADTGSLAAPAIREYNRAYVHDLLDHYPEINGLRPDWPEYPCYKLDEAFQDFGPAVKRWTEDKCFDFEGIQRSVAELYRRVHGGQNDRDLLHIGSPARGVFSIVSALRHEPRLMEWLKLKAALSVDILEHWRSTLNEYGGADKELSPNAFMPPFTLLTGFDFDTAGDICAAVSPKLYTMHWSVMIQFWAETLLASNAGLSEHCVVRALASLFDLADENTAERISDYGYPEPNELHPIPTCVLRRKIEQALAQANGKTAITPLVHGYGPLEDFSRRLQVVADSAVDGAWINRYGYLSDQKLDAVGQIWH